MTLQPKKKNKTKKRTKQNKTQQKPTELENWNWLMLGQTVDFKYARLL